MADDNVMGPPVEPVECVCIHCNRIFMSDLMIRIDVDDETHWMCPVPGCGALGYQFDIWPTDFNHPDGGWVDDDPDEEDDGFRPGDELADEIADRMGHFDPPTDWTPDADRADDLEDIPFGEFDDGEEVEPEFDAGESGEVTHPSMYFTREDHDAAVAAGVYDEAIEREREHWRRIRQDERDRKSRIERGETLPGDTFSEDDIPF